MARAGDRGTSQRFHGASRQAIDADIITAKINRQIAHRTFKRGFGNAHDIIVRGDTLGTDIAQGHKRSASGHHMACGLCGFGKGKGRDHHRIGEILPTGIHIAAFKLALVGKGQSMNHEINR